MVYITGDIHGELDIHKLGARYFHAKHLTKKDYVIILGDFGLIWDAEPDRHEQYWLRWLDDKEWTTLFVDGNHENHPRLASYPVETWHGGKVHRISKTVYHLMRGQVYELDGRTLFTMGGARSSDIMYRKEGVSWWPEELPSTEEYQEAERNLAAANYQIDYILTHELPTKQLLELYPNTDSYELSNFLNSVRKGVSYRHWFAGHHHMDRTLSNHVHVCYDGVYLLEDIEKDGTGQSHSSFEQIQLQPGDDLDDEWQVLEGMLQLGRLTDAQIAQRDAEYDADMAAIAALEGGN